MGFINKILINKWLYKIWTTLFVLVGLFFVLPLYLIEPLMWVWLAYTILNYSELDWKFRREKLPLIFLGLFYLFESLSLFYSANLGYGLGMLNRYLPVFILTMLAFVTPLVKIPIRKTIPMFIKSLSVGLSLCILFILLSFIFDQSLIAFLNINVDAAFREVIGKWMHRSYLSLGLAIVTIISYLFVENKKSLLYWCISYLAVFLFVWKAGARIPILYILLIGVGVTLDLSFRSYGKKIIWIVGICLSALVVFLIINISEFSIIKNAVAVQNNELLKLDSRFQIWHSIKPLITSHILSGVGIGDAKLKILEAYHKNGFALGEILELNTHNQFLQFWIDAGVFSMLSFLLGIITIIFSFRNISITVRLLYVFVLLMALLVENVLARSAGKEMVLFSFLLLYYINNQKVDRVSGYTSCWKFFTIGTFGLLILFVFFPYQLFFKMNPDEPETYRNEAFKVLDYADLPGNIPNELSLKTRGLLLDTFTFKGLDEEKTYDVTLFARYKTKFGDSIMASVFTYVSKEYNGDDVFLFSKDEMTKYIADTVVNKGTWQHLNISHSCAEGKLVIGFYCGLKKGQNPKELKGSVIFAHPEAILLEGDN